MPPSWDFYDSLIEACDKLSKATGCSFILAMAHAADEPDSDGVLRVVAKAHGGFSGPEAMQAIEEGLNEVFDDAYAHFGLCEEGEDWMGDDQ